ncbi:MAG: DUF2188 domain-containing protein [Bacteroidetes bacterium]|nr:DUF2188 domain-containing protein [Bacteroidota bacterium]
MPWTKTNYPNSMKNLPEEVRNKAIEIGNALLEEGKMEEGIAIATAISRAKDWAAEHGKKFENPEKSRITDVKQHGQDRIVIPYENEWAIKVEGRAAVEKIFHTKQEAVKEARKEAKDVNGSLTIQRKTGKVEKRISYNPKNIGSQTNNKKT